MKQIRWGIIGCGNVTEVKSGPAFRKAAGSALAAVMRRNGALAEDYARRHGVSRWYDDADALIADPAVDAVYVGAHLEMALKVCQAGKPCYVEKPMARNATEAQAMVDAFRAARLPLFVAYYRRGLPRFLRAKEIVAAGRLGVLTGVMYSMNQPLRKDFNPEKPEWRYVAERSGGGLFMDLGSHTLDAIDFVAGPIAEVAGTACNRASAYEVEDHVAMHCRFESGALGTADWNFASAMRTDTIVFVGTEGRLTLSTFGGEPVCLETPDGREEFDLPNPPHIQQPLVQSIVDQLLGGGPCASTGDSALRTARVMDRVLESYYAGRSDDFWNRPATWPGRPGR